MKTKTTLLIASLLVATLHAQEKPADPYRGAPVAVKSTDPTDNPFAERDPKSETVPDNNISICYEAFSLPLAMAADLQRQRLSDPALYAKLISELGKESIRQEIFQILRAKSSNKATTESTSEHIYPTEYDPHTAAAKPDSEPKVATVGNGVFPTAWETRNRGLTLEIEPTLSDDNRFVDLRLLPQMVTLAGYIKWETPSSPDVKMPEFENQSVDTSASLLLNQPFLLGSMSRPPVSQVDSDSANRVWFAFVTATLAKY